MKYIIIALVLLAVASGVFISRKPKLVDKSLATYTGPTSDYAGNKKLVVAFTASWASFWKITEEELAKIDLSTFDLSIKDQEIDKDEIQKFGIKFLPTVLVIENGKITKQIQNLSKIEQLKE